MAALVPSARRVDADAGEAVANELEAAHRPSDRLGRGVDTSHFKPERRSAGWRRWLAAATIPRSSCMSGGSRPRRTSTSSPTRGAPRASTWASVRRSCWPGRAGSKPPARAAALGRELGFLDRDKLADVYASADICVLPSKTETCGLVALEAMASGLAVIAADAGGFRESITHGQTGRLVAPEDATGFAAEILSLAISPQRRTALGTAARAAAVARDVAPENLALLQQYAKAAGLSNAGAASCAG